MADNVPFALMRGEYGAPGPRRAYNIPVVVPPAPGLCNPVIAIVSAEKAAGRDFATNLYGTYLHLAGRPFAIVELSAAPSNASQAHKGDGSAAALVNPLEEAWYIRLLDQLDQHAGKAVLLTVPALFWRTFVKLEPALIRHVLGVRQLGYAVVASERTAALVTQHRQWIGSRGFPTLPHRLVVRGLPLVNVPTWQHKDPATTTMLMPHVERQLSDAMSDRAQPATFHAAWRAATSGTQAAMFDGVERALREFGQFLGDVMLAETGRTAAAAAAVS